MLLLLFGGECSDEHVKMACVGRCQDGSGGGTSHWSLELSGLRIKKECGDLSKLGMSGLRGNT